MIYLFIFSNKTMKSRKHKCNQTVPKNPPDLNLQVCTSTPPEFFEAFLRVFFRSSLMFLWIKMLFFKFQKNQSTPAQRDPDQFPTNLLSSSWLTTVYSVNEKTQMVNKTAEISHVVLCFCAWSMWRLGQKHLRKSWTRVRLRMHLPNICAPMKHFQIWQIMINRQKYE